MIEMALTPNACASRTTESASAWLARALTMTCAPSRARCSTVALPILRPEPVTSATFPPSLPITPSLDFIRDVEESPSNGNYLFREAPRAKVSRISQKKDDMLLPHGHDAWSVGNEPCVFVEFSRGNDYYASGYVNEERLFQQSGPKGM